ncbi:MAG: alpha/beta fold hydrolase [Cyclobacteriaceae bacterium]|nr:alpha/beta fold hydrolase [Cyclobacteriaceae bacterium]
MKLHYRKSGAGRPLIILHGLLGSSDNWFSLAKVFAESFEVYLVDQRNHGQSPHSAEFNYPVMVEDLHAFIQEHNLHQPVVIGHSMGGKTAMNFAVKYPNLLSQLIVVDIVPKVYPVHHDHILDGLHAIDLASLTSRTEADTILSRHVAERDVRQFLLKNLFRTSESAFAWRVNLAAIDAHIEEIGEGMHYAGTYAGATLFIMGARSNYYAEGDEPVIKKIFPQAEIVALETGHWVQAEKPVEFSNTVLQFLKRA